jgi:hypothetical protein
VQYVEGEVRFIVKAVGELNVQNLVSDEGLANIDPSMLDSLRGEDVPSIEKVRNEAAD